MSHQVDRVVDDLSSALLQLKHAMRGMPLNQNGFRAAHDKAARAMGTLTTELLDARPAMT
ncbi:hypothetical protein DL990_30415 [Amycolatopsis sp. WAC 01416]|uniref:hypothetical protein n=1 Tax=Amycolatopsis sp. WAC 01416 TaxID=2203196 RepID=UPI000F77266B|nr:hypothetical protein [Amycolatopsis sp. WAC 01416]RSN27491.1 hypothetical protein DL990_30415 [Amycolatopsis sp. WAC 01416]